MPIPSARQGVHPSLIFPLLLGEQQGAAEEADLLVVLIDRCAKHGWEAQIHIHDLWTQLFQSDDAKGPKKGWEATEVATGALVRLALKGYVVMVKRDWIMVTNLVPELLRSIEAAAR
ncbi:hypothetical protein KBD34_04200 [Patescibacteria group bacterium]|nr:hypothetical protein [Patescibacteria group bacterium]